MKKILVTTDLSYDSKAAIRFAIQLASQTEYELTFLYVNTSFIIDPFAAVTFIGLPEPHNKLQEQKLIKFIHTLYKQTSKQPGKINYIAENKLDVNEAILDCAKRIKADYICMSTRGGGLVHKLLGSHTSKILRDSPVPVLVVPKYYRMKHLNSVLYPSDIENINIELPLIKKFAAAFNAPITVYHYDYFTEVDEIHKKLNKIEHKFKSDKVSFHLKKLNPEISLLRHLQIDIIKIKPSIITMFAKEDRSWFELLFQSIKTSEKGFDTKTPVLVFRK
ncbi:universal stress protein [Flavobacterium piscis]|uniref:Nucleotide-binding universal stress UspA family protein n=1 Tax=Flavobacterium piscis TaxID=1114874 RepID=A0ABU1YCM5_9FLAO|nr:universal stress protein [Flavobacterium piscis]MDR7211903.1 nucleotide-binding universal stress UspA family protein [Flavobacterium piscis]